MAQFAEFLLNLLLLRRKFNATETLHEVVQRCLKYNRKILMEYNKALQMAGPFENMLEFINYNATHYTCEGKNYAVTSEVQYNFYEELRKIVDQENVMLQKENRKKRTNENALTAQKKSENLDSEHNKIKKNPNINTNQSSEHHEREKKRKIKNQDYLVDNLQAILKSQELLFKNIIKLVQFLEKDATFNVNIGKLEQIKKKLLSCTDVLSQTPGSRIFSDLIDNIIEDEITRCRFRHGECKTSKEISLKVKRPEGLAVVLETSTKMEADNTKSDRNEKKISKADPKPHKAIKLERKNETLPLKEIDSEVINHSAELVKQIKSVPDLSLQILESTEEKQAGEYKIQRINDMGDSKKLVELNEERFHQFEETLWHSLTTMKFMALKDDYVDRCKTAFYNRRQFIALESALSKQLKDREETENIQKFLSVSESMFQIMERKLLFDELKEKIKCTYKGNNEIFEIINKAVKLEPSESKSAENNTEDKQKTSMKIKPVAKVQNQQQTAENRKSNNYCNDNSDQNLMEKPSTTQETNTSVPEKNLTKTESKQINVNKGINKNYVKLYKTYENNEHEPKTEVDNVGSEKNIEVSEIKVVVNLFNIIKKASDSKYQHETLALQIIANPDGKLLNVQGKVPSQKCSKCPSVVQLKDEANLIEINKKAFDEMESTLHTVRNFTNRHPVIVKSKTAVKTSTETKKNKLSEPIKKGLSTKTFETGRTQSVRSYNKRQINGDSEKTRISTSAGRTFIKTKHNFQHEKLGDKQCKQVLEKRKTFLKSASQQCILERNILLHKIEIKRSQHTFSKSIADVSNNKALQMRRTTKSVMKKQVLTIFPKITKKNVEKRKPKISSIQPNETSALKSVKNNENKKSCMSFELEALYNTHK